MASARRRPTRRTPGRRDPGRRWPALRTRIPGSPARRAPDTRDRRTAGQAAAPGTRRIPGLRIAPGRNTPDRRTPGRRTGAGWRTRLVRVLALGGLEVPLLTVRSWLGVAGPLGVLGLLRVAGLIAVTASGRQGAGRSAAEHHRAGRIVGAQGAEITRHRAGEISLTAEITTAPVTGQRREPRVGRGTGKLARVAARVPRVGVAGVHAALQGVDQPGQFLLGQPERTGTGPSLPDAEHRDPGIRIPAQAHAAGAAAHVEENLAEPGQGRCVRR